VARKIRVQYAGAIYHVMSRGDRKNVIFKDEKDHLIFLETLEQVCQKTGWQVHAWCLMGNHFHLVLETPQPNLVEGMKWFLGTYTARFNRRHKLCGHLFSGRYKALIIDGSGNGYLRTACDYVHLNPVRGRRLKTGQSLEAYRWSSYLNYLTTPKQRPKWLRVDRLFGEMGIKEDSAAGRRQFHEEMETRRAQEMGEAWRRIRRGWCLGSASFRGQILDMMEGKVKAHNYGQERRESAQERGLRLIDEEMLRQGWTQEGELERRKKSDPVKVALALRLRTETTLTIQWIAEQLHMGSREYASRLLYEAKKKILS
jgi:REP element-mobilizing transposase RayT